MIGRRFNDSLMQCLQQEMVQSHSTSIWKFRCSFEHKFFQQKCTITSCVGWMPTSVTTKPIPSIPIFIDLNGSLRTNSFIRKPQVYRKLTTGSCIVFQLRQYHGVSLGFSQQHHNPQEDKPTQGNSYHQHQQQQQHQRYYTTEPPMRQLPNDKTVEFGDVDDNVITFLKEALLCDSTRITLDFLANNDDDILQSTIHSILKILEPVYGKKITLSQLQSFGKDGIKELAQSIHREEQQKKKKENQQGNNMTKTSIQLQIQIQIPHHKTSYTVQWRIGQSILDVVIANSDLLSEYIEGTCGGQMSCCTCHIYIPTTTSITPTDDKSMTTSSTITDDDDNNNNSIFSTAIQQLQPIDESELDMLDLAYDRQENSRLGCQIKLTPTLLQYLIQNKVSFVSISIPSGVNNVWTD
jgi:ferredoxin